MYYIVRSGADVLSPSPLEYLMENSITLYGVGDMLTGYIKNMLFYYLTGL